jgi:ABC-type nickel/cobalt efflux system permease component RcnA
MTTTEWVILVVVVAIIIIAAIWWFVQSRRSHALHEDFGPEYDRTVQQSDSRRAAETELRNRRERVEKLDIRPLSITDRDRFAREWETLQPRFVDDPKGAVSDADSLVSDLMRTRGYPMGDFEQRAADISVDHPDVVNHYREAHRLAQRNASDQATTEEQRRALVHYRELFNDLLSDGLPDAAPSRGVSQTG